MEVKRRTQQLIYPSLASPCTLLQLSNNDQIMPRLYTSMIFFFNPPPTPQEASNASHLLTTSLPDLLSVFYPCAGRYTERENGALEVQCCDQGAIFCEAWVDVNLAAFGDFQPNPDFRLLVPETNPFALISDLPILLVQITHFECGGLSLGVQLHHSISDGNSMGEFLKSWAEITSGKEIACPPYLDRSLLKPRLPPSPLFDHFEYSTSMPEMPSTWPEMTSRIFKFTPETIQALKAQARQEGAASSYSGFESLAAHLWRCVTKVRELEATEEVRLGMAVDGRSRFDPPLPEGYFGNVNFYGCAISKVGDLEEKPLSYAANLVHDAIVRITDDYMRSALDWVEQQGAPKSIIASFCRPFKDLAITSWARFPLYDLEFGWGKPAAVGIPVSGFEGLVVLLPSSAGQGHIDALVGLRIEQMRKFQALPHLLP